MALFLSSNENFSLWNKVFCCSLSLCGCLSVYSLCNAKTVKKSSELKKKTVDTDTNTDKKQYEPHLTITGIKDKNILKAINDQIEVASDKTTILERQFWIKRNTKILREVIYTFGYFDAEIIPANNKTSKKFEVKLNDRYRIADVIGCPAMLPPDKFFKLTGLGKGNPFLGSEVSSATNKIRDFYQENGFAFVHVGTPDIELDKKNKTVNVIYNIEPGKIIKIRNTIINIKCKKSSKLLEPFIRNRITWKRGDIYDSKKITQFKDDLVQYELFASLEVKLSEPECNSNSAYACSDIILNLEEASLRNTELGAKFSTTQAFNLHAGWKHYNIDGKGSTFEICGNIAKDEQTIKLEHGYYDVFFKNQKLATQAGFVREDESSYNVLKYGINSMLWQSIGYRLKFGLGGLGEFSKTIDKVVENENQINKNVNYIQTLGIPLSLKVNFTDNNLDPHRGVSIDTSFTPMFSKSVTYSKLLATMYGYFSISRNNYSDYGITCAIYAKYGTMYGNTSSLTRDKMFFAGGANSIRGYGEKKLGKLLNRIPYGGTSLMEAGLECRIRFNDTFGGAVFAEMGKVYSKNEQQDWMTGWGFGIRYYTIMGPIRVDVAFPTKRRKDKDGKYIDSLLNIYVGIGQSF